VRTIMSDLVDSSVEKMDEKAVDRGQGQTGNSRSRDRNRDRSEGRDRREERDRGGERDRKDDRDRGVERDRREDRGRGVDRDRREDRERGGERERSGRDAPRERSPDRNRDSGRYRGSREYERDGYRRRSRSHSRERYSRHRSPSPDYRQAKKKVAVAPAGNKFWDGFQWVEKTPSEPIAADGTGAAIVIPNNPLGLPKDRRIYVGNLPDDCDTENLKQFMNQTLAVCGGVPTGMNAVLSLWMSGDNKYGFLEMCTGDVATIAMGLNGISYQGCCK
jgi:splicing factor U2AF subunit